MPREDQHRAWAERNEAFAESLDPSAPVEENWAIVAAFYAALHYVQAYFAKHGETCVDHGDRDEKIKKDRNLTPLYSPYKYLYSLSRDARYRCSLVQARAYTEKAKPALAAVKIQIHHLLQIEKQRQLSRRIEIPAEPAHPSPGQPKK